MVTRERRTAFTVLAIILVVAGAFVLKALFEERYTVGGDGCLIEESDRALYTILIDSSDKLAAQQAAILERTLKQRVAKAKRGARVAIYRLTKVSEKPIEVVVEGCAPGEEHNTWLEPPARWEERRERFDQAISRALRENIAGQPLSQSPILEAILAIETKEYRNMVNREKILILASDMLQYTNSVENLNHYQRLVPFDIFAKTGQYQSRKPNLMGINVEILYLLRESHIESQSNDHITWWQLLITNSNGSLDRVEKIRGDFQ